MAHPRTRQPRAELKQLHLELGALPPLDALIGGATIAGLRLTMTRPLLAHPSCARSIAVVRETLHFFPELDGIALKVGLTRAAAGFASMESDHIWLNPHRLSRHTVAHEFVHLLQRRGLVPRGEKSCDLFALARHPDLADDIPAYAKVPITLHRTWCTTPASGRAAVMGRLLYETARDSVARRDAGSRRYIAWFESELARRWEDARRDAPREPSPGTLW